jgi:hypothetical protein
LEFALGDKNMYSVVKSYVNIDNKKYLTYGLKCENGYVFEDLTDDYNKILRFVENLIKEKADFYELPFLIEDFLSE